MRTVTDCSTPKSAFLQTYVASNDFTDCYTCTVPIEVRLEQYVTAFYTTRLFKLERFILKWVASRPSTDEQVRDLATGVADRFAAWSVEQRDADQLLLCDFQGRTRSWLMVQPDPQKEPGIRSFFSGRLWWHKQTRILVRGK